jgi:RHS repeat-associated protein
MRTRPVLRALVLALGLLVATASGAADPSYLAQDAPDVVFGSASPIIQGKADALGHDPLRIFEFVRNELEFQVYYGLMKGPEGTLLSGGGNDYDLAALLVSLLRASNIPARFVRGKVRVPSQQAIEWTGVDSALAVDYYLSLAYPASWNPYPHPLRVWRPTGSVELLHIWVEAEVPMAKYRGSGPDPSARGLAWVPLDPSFKRSEWKPSPGLPIGADPALTFDYGGTDGLYARVRAKLPAEIFEDQVRSYLAGGYGGSGALPSVDDARHFGRIRAEAPGVLPNSLPYSLRPPDEDLGPPARAASLVALHQPPLTPHPDAGVNGAADYRYLRSVHVCTSETSGCDSLPISHAHKLVEASGWSAAWEGRRVVLWFPPTPGSAGNLKDEGYESCRDQSGNPIQTIPTLSVDGAEVAEADSSVELCTSYTVVVKDDLPLDLIYGESRSEHTAAGGGVYLAGFDSHASSATRVRLAAERLVAARDQYPLEKVASSERAYVDANRNQIKDGGELYLSQHIEAQEALTGGLLHLSNTWYWQVGRSGTKRIHEFYQERPLYFPAAGLISSGREVAYLFEVPFSIQPSNLVVDIKGALAAEVSRATGLPPGAVNSFDLASNHLSAVEHAVWEEIGGLEGVSTVKGLQLGKEALGNDLLMIPTEISYTGALSSCDPFVCTGVDIYTYCEIKKSFGYAPCTLCNPSCPTNYSGTTNELRIMDRSAMDYHGWHGYVFVRRYQEGGSQKQYMAIEPLAGGAGVAIDEYWLNPLSDPQRIDTYSFDRDWIYNLPSFQKVTAGDPVSALNGNYYEAHTDIEIAGPGGMGLKLVRSYNSRLDHPSSMGFGWMHTFEQHLREEEGEEASGDEEVIWVSETGSETPWEDDGATLIPREWSHDDLVREPGGSYRLTTKEGWEYRFLPADGDGIARLDSITDRDGNTNTCQYAGGRLASVTDAAGRTLQFFYDAGDHLEEIREWSGRAWRYTVDENGDLVSFMDPVQVAREELVSGSGKPWVYEYYSGLSNAPLNHNLRRYTKPEDRDGIGGGDSWMELVYYSNDTVYKHTDSLGRETRFSYNYFRKRTDVVHPDGAGETYFYDSYGNVIRHEGPGGAVSEFEYDGPRRERILEIDALGFETGAAYDDDGNRISRTDRTGETESWTYNELGQWLTWTDRRGHTQRRRYGDSGNLLVEYVPLGGREELAREHSYDGWGNRVETLQRFGGSGGEVARTRFEYDADGVAVARVIDPYGHATRITSDALGRPIRVERDRSVPGGGKGVLERVVVESGYDELGRVIATTDPSGLITETEWDANGLVKEVRSVIPDPGAAGPRVRVDASHDYDAMDRRIATSDALGHTSQIAYDERDRVSLTTTPLGRVRQIEYDAAGNPVREVDGAGGVTSGEFDPLGRVVRVTDALGRETATEYDPEGRVTKVVGPGGRTVFEAVGYDENGNLLGWRDAGGWLFVNGYDELNRRIEDRGPVGTPEEGTTGFSYDLTGLLLEKVDAKGRVRRVRYDLLGRVVEATDALGRSSYYGYDEVGNLVESVNGAGEVVRYRHDGRGLLVRRSGPGIDHRFRYDALGRGVFESAGGESRRFEYDDLDRVVARTDATAGSERFHYDEDGLLVQHVQPGSSWSGGDAEVVVGYGYDERGGLAWVRDPDAGDWQLERDALGRLTQRRDPSGGEWRALYTEEGFIDRIDISVPGAGGDYVDYSGYDDLGNPEVITTGEGTTSVIYDSLSRVTQVSYPGSGGSEGFGYDLVGNRISHTDRSGTEHEHVVDAADQLREIKVGQTVLESFGYDGAGRRISRVVSGGETTQYGYNALGALVSVSGPGYGAVLGYDAEGQVSVRSEAGGTSYYPSPALESRGGHVHRILRSPQTGAVISEVERTAIGHRVHQAYRDGGHNVVQMAIQEEDLGVSFESPAARYEAFGLHRSGGTGLERGYAGQVREGETGLIRMGMRHYDPATGRFLQADPLGIAASELYAYASSNPYRFWDPTGLDPQALSEVVVDTAVDWGYTGLNTVGAATGRFVEWYAVGDDYDPGEFAKLELGGELGLFHVGTVEFGSYAGRDFAGNPHGGYFLDLGWSVGWAASLNATVERIFGVNDIRGLSVSAGLSVYFATFGVGAPEFGGDRSLGAYGGKNLFECGLECVKAARFGLSYGLPFEATGGIQRTWAVDPVGWYLGTDFARGTLGHEH